MGVSNPNLSLQCPRQPEAGPRGTRQGGDLPLELVPTNKLSTLIGERGSRMSASSFLWRPAPAPSPGAVSGAPGIFPVGRGRLMPLRRA